MKNKYKIPFSKNIDRMLYYVDDNYFNVEWKDNYIFDDDLKYIGYNGGRSAMTMVLESVNNLRKYYMFWTYFDECIRRDNNSPGPVFHGKWTFIKTGKNYSVKPVEEEN